MTRIPDTPVSPSDDEACPAKTSQVYVRQVSGRFANWRIAAVLLSQLIFYAGPWLTWNGRQAVLFHLVERKFYLFGLVLWPQDVIYLAVLLIIAAYALFLSAAIGGRLFCGYGCPQTVYTQIFMWIEHWVEGDRSARIKLDRAPITPRTLRIKGTKHALWILLSLWTGVTLVAYFTPVSELLEEAGTLSFGHWEITWIVCYANFTYVMAGLLREQVCHFMCPYARFQGAMFDPDTLVIAYDHQRGEPRGARKKGEDFEALGLGACIDCGVCRQVCPAGMDIRNGPQYECIACASCIDACDQVMDSMGYSRGLVRYSTGNAGSRRAPGQPITVRIFRSRTLIYMSILAAIIGATAWSLAHRVPLKVDVILDRTILARSADDGKFENIYLLRLTNADEQAHRYHIDVDGLDGFEVSRGNEIEVPAVTTKEIPVAVHTTRTAGLGASTPIFFQVSALDDNVIHIQEKAVFLLP